MTTTTTINVRSILALIAADQDPDIRDNGRDGETGSISIDTDNGPHEITATQWGEDTVEMQFTVDRATAAALARAYDGIAAGVKLDAGPALLAALKAMREELEEMSGYWTERMDTLAQMADAAIEAAEGKAPVVAGPVTASNDFTREDEDTAAEEHWGLFESDERGLEIQRVDSPEDGEPCQFESDEEAREHVAVLAGHGYGTHKRALAAVEKARRERQARAFAETRTAVVEAGKEVARCPECGGKVSSVFDHVAGPCPAQDEVTRA